MLSAVAVVTAALVAGGAVLLLVLQWSLTSTTRDRVSVRAADLSRLLAEQGVEETQQTLDEDRRSDERVQILDAAGRVVAWTDRRLTGQPMSRLRPAPGHGAVEQLPELPQLGDTDEVLVAGRGVEAAGRAYVVLVALPIQLETQTVSTVALLLLAGAPLLVGLVAIAVWVLVGRSLATVEGIRRQVAEIDARRLGERVDVPATHDEVAALASTMNQMLDKLERSDRSQRAFFSDASHELRSPLSTVVTTAEVASLDPTGRTWTDLQGTVLRESTRMQALVEDLLTLAKVDGQGLDVVREEVDLEDILDAETRRLRALSKHDLTVELWPVRVLGDERRLTQVFRNVLDNADRHARTAIAIGIRREGSDVVVMIDNDGDPIDVADRERVFDRFVRLDASRPHDGGGSGLGLAISAEIAALHGGSVRATEANGWCRFEVVLPVGQ